MRALGLQPWRMGRIMKLSIMMEKGERRGLEGLVGK